MRLENIGFREIDGTIKPVLLDLDSFLPYQSKPFTVSTGSRMSFPPAKLSREEANNKHLDWKQFGLMAAYVASDPNPVTHKQYHDEDFKFGSEVEDDPFIQKLLSEGNTSQHSRRLTRAYMY